MRKPLFTGVCTALVTPFINGQINYPMMEMLLRRQMDAGIRAAVICGTTGEAATLTDREKTELFRRCKAYVGDKMLIIAGTGSNNTSHAVSLSVEAQKAGADGLLVVSPYYNKATAEGLTEHFSAIAQAVEIPVILYNVPPRTGVDIPVSVYKKLSKVSNIVGVKEASTDIEKMLKIRMECSPDFYIWSGNDHMTVPVISIGGQGVISVISNVVPEQMRTMTDAALREKYHTAAALQCALQPLTELMFCEVNPIPVKAAMELMGYDCGICRLPLTKISPENYDRLKNLLK